MVSGRVEQALERLQEDGTLTGDVTDTEAVPVLAWAEAQIIAADSISDDATFAQRVAAIRAAARAATRSIDDSVPIVERAERALSGAGSARTTNRAHGVGDDSAGSALAPQHRSASAAAALLRGRSSEQPSANTRAALPRTPSRSAFCSTRRRPRRWTYRKVV